MCIADAAAAAARAAARAAASCCPFLFPYSPYPCWTVRHIPLSFYVWQGHTVLRSSRLPGNIYRWYTEVGTLQLFLPGYFYRTQANRERVCNSLPQSNAMRKSGIIHAPQLIAA